MGVMSEEKIVITAALPYANGSLHLGHMVEYIQADIFARAQKLLGKEVAFCCADDTHGAPIELKAKQLGITPEKLIGKYHKEHEKDFKDFLIHFDSYYSTNSKENQEYSDFIYGELKKKGLIYKKVMDVNYCPKDKRFLPDRYVKGTCPNCKAEDQYGDVCEKCNKTHKTTDLIDPQCSLCGTKPEEKQSEHLFFKLSTFEKKLKKFLKDSDIQDEVRNFVLNWLKDLKDWCISRDGPYFGFPIPDEKNKYYYVWLDAPIGYISSTANYCEEKGLNVDDYWRKKSGKIIHIIGKDIMYFHLLFWPAMLMTAGFNLPSKIQVHGFLTVNKEKMSKSRGTFITARRYLDHLKPEYLRFYFAAHLSDKITDLDFSIAHFKEMINAELIGNIGNFCNRALSFTDKNFDRKVGVFENSETKKLWKEVEKRFSVIEKAYSSFNFKEVVREVEAITALGNKYFQDSEPWKLIKEDKDKAHEVLSFSLVLIKNVSVLLSPILPSFCNSLQKQLGFKDLAWDDLGFAYGKKSFASSGIILHTLQDEVDSLIVEKKEKFLLELRVGKVISVEQHPDADKLYVEKVDMGNGDVRTIVSGLKEYMDMEELNGKKVIVVANLKPAKLRGVKSEGMLLVGEKGKKLSLLDASACEVGELAYFGAKGTSFKQIEYKEFSKIKMSAKDKKVVLGKAGLHTDSGEIAVDIADGADVC